MTSEIILNNTFFAFWHIWGEYFIFLIAFGLTMTIIIGIIYLLTKR